MIDHRDTSLAFVFRCSLAPGPKLLVWYQIEGTPEIGPIEIDETNAAKLRVLIEEAVSILSPSAQDAVTTAPKDWTVCDTETGEEFGVYRAMTSDEAVAVCRANRQLSNRSLHANPAPPGAWESQKEQLGHEAVERYLTARRSENAKKN